MIRVISMELKHPARQLFRQGIGSLAMTIPADWAREHCLEAGHMVRVRPVKNGLHISLEGPKDRKARMIKLQSESSANDLKMALEGKGRDKS